MLTYGQLLEKLYELTPEQLTQTVTVFNLDNMETFGMLGADITGQEHEQDLRPERDVLDSGHFYLFG